MRRFICVATLMVGMVVCQTSSAQFAAGTTNARPSASGRNNGTAFFSPFNSLRSTFRLSSLFPDLSGANGTTRTPVGYTTIPAPGTPAYFKAFGYKKLY